MKAAQFNSSTVYRIPLYQDNYAWLVTDAKQAWIIDPGQAGPVTEIIRTLDVELAGMLITHRHWDHVNGIDELSDIFPVPVYGPPNIHDGITHAIGEGDQLSLGGTTIDVWHTPGHTADHLSFYCQEAKWLFCGDTLFSAGCGRIKSTGNITDLFNSLNRINSLHKETLIFCSHEYTEANLKFARMVEPENIAIIKYQEKVHSLRKNNIPSIPSQLREERTLNPFLRCNESSVKTNIADLKAAQTSSPLDVFKTLRQWKDRAQ